VKSRPKTGEKRQVRQPLKIDKLPVGMRDRIQAERAAGRTWEEIEELSPGFLEWKDVPDDVHRLFPKCRLPHTSLARWWDLRVDQVRRDVMKRAETARELAAAFAGRGMEKLPEAVMNALRDLVFSVLEQSDAKSKGAAIKSLSELGWLVSEMQKSKVQEERLKVEGRRVTLSEREFEIRKKKFDKETNDAARKLGKGKPITEDDINRIRERTFGLPPVQRDAATSHPA
jgi:hypothetical protein